VSSSHRCLRFSACLAAVVLLSACGSAVPTTSAGTTSSSSTSTSTTTLPPSTTPSKPVPYAWQRDAATALDIGGGSTVTLSAVLSPAGRHGDWMIAGTRLAASGTTTAMLWTSSDTRTWRPTALPGTDGRALAATRWGTQTVVVGSVGAGAARRAAVWVSPGADQPFAAVPASAALDATPEAPAGSKTTVLGGASMNVVGAGTLGVFAAGSSSGRPAMWYSTNGTDWQRASGAENLLDDADDAQVTSVLVTTAGVYVSGTVQTGTDTDGQLWISSDSVHWRAYFASDNPFKGPDDHAVEGLADMNGSLVAVGAVRSGPSWTPASWVSPDGVSWTEPDEAIPTASRPQAVDGAGTVIRDVVSTSRGLVAVGGSGASQRLWTSPDGVTWAEVTLPAAAADSSTWSADLVASNGPTTVVVDDQTGQSHVLVDGPGGWDDVTASTTAFGAPLTVATPVAVARDGGRLVLAVDVDRPARALGGAASETAAVLASSDGKAWQVLAEGGSLARARIEDLAVSGDQLVAVGERSRRSGGSPAPAVWTSSTGRRWTLVSGLSVGSGTVAAVVADGSVADGPKTEAFGSAGRTTSAAGEVPVTWGLTKGHKQLSQLDQVISLGAARPLAACSYGHQVAVVGTATRAVPPPPSTPTAGTTGTTTTTAAPTPTTTVPHTGSTASTAGQGNDGSMAVAWSSLGGSWTRASVVPVTGVGADVRMLGCVATSQGWIAYGEAPGPHGQDVPSLWSSTDGTTWTLLDRPSLQETETAPFTDLQVNGSTWSAVSGGGSATGQPLVTTGDPTTATGPDGDAGVWLSTDAGAVWGQVTTTGSAWSGVTVATDDLVTIGGQLVVVGSDDGRLAVWSGRPA
jgi:hypothetical protein